MVLIVLTFPLINLFVDKPVVMVPETLNGKSALFQRAAPVIQESCLVCHSLKTQMPWYASLPIAKQIVGNNIREARKELDLEKELFTPNQAPTKKTLVKIKSQIREGEMPPLEYQAMHWKAILSAKEKQAILDWIQEQQSVP